MPKEPSGRVELLQGTLDMLILRTLLTGPAHGHQIAKHLQRTTDNVLQVEHGSLYPALHRLERQGWVKSEWKLSEAGQRAKFYRITTSGKKQLAGEQERWTQMAAAIAGIMNRTPEEV